MAGIVYLRTNKFEVKLEGITFKAREFDSLCKVDFLFPKGKVWVRPPIVGVDVMRHPRDPSILLLLLCFGVGCVILRFKSGESLPKSILKFLTDERIRFVGFGIPEKIDIFPFDELGLSKTKIDVGYLAAKILNDSRYKTCELAELSKEVLGIKKMVGLTNASSSFERHEPIKAGICQLFVTSVIAMALLQTDAKKRLTESPKKRSFFKSLGLLPLLNEGWFKVSKEKKHNSKFSHFVESCYRAKFRDDVLSEDSFYHDPKCNKGGFINELFRSKSHKEGGFDGFFRSKIHKDGVFDGLFRSKSSKEGGFDGVFSTKSNKEGDFDDVFCTKSNKGGFDDVWAHVKYMESFMGDDVWSDKSSRNFKNSDSSRPKLRVRGSSDDFVCPYKCKECGSGDFGVQAKDMGYKFDVAKTKERGFNNDNDVDYIHSSSSGDEFAKTETSPSKKVPLKGILKCPSGCNHSPPLGSEQKSSPNQKQSPNLKRANSKGYNVTFKELPE